MEQSGQEFDGFRPLSVAGFLVHRFTNRARSPGKNAPFPFEKVRSPGLYREPLHPLQHPLVDSIVPSKLATAVVTYSIITWTGMFIFGRESWLLYGDPFSVLFRLLSRCSIVELRVASSEHCPECPELCPNQDED